MLLAVAIVTAIFAGVQRSNANQSAAEAKSQRDRANDRANVATAERFAALATAQAARGHDQALLLGVEGFERSDSPTTRSALLGALSAEPQLVGFTPGATDTTTSTVAPDGKLVVSATRDGSLRFWDVHRPGGLSAVVAPPATLKNDPVVALTFDHAGRELFALQTDGRVQEWDAASRRPHGAPMPIGKPGALSIAVNTDDRVVAVTGLGPQEVANIGQRTVLYDVVARLRVRSIAGSGNAAFSPDGSTVYVWGAAGVLAFDARDGRPNRAAALSAFERLVEPECVRDRDRRRGATAPRRCVGQRRVRSALRCELGRHRHRQGARHVLRGCHRQRDRHESRRQCDRGRGCRRQPDIVVVARGAYARALPYRLGSEPLGARAAAGLARQRRVDRVRRRRPTHVDDGDRWHHNVVGSFRCGRARWRSAHNTARPPIRVEREWERGFDRGRRGAHLEHRERCTELRRRVRNERGDHDARLRRERCGSVLSRGNAGDLRRPRVPRGVPGLRLPSGLTGKAILGASGSSRYAFAAPAPALSQEFIYEGTNEPLAAIDLWTGRAVGSIRPEAVRKVLARAHPHPQGDAGPIAFMTVAFYAKNGVVNPGQIAIDGTGQYAATISLAGDLVVWDLRTAEPVGPPIIADEHDDLQASSVAFSPDGRELAVGRYDGTIVRYSVPGLRAVGNILSAHPAAIGGVAYQPRGSLLAAASAAGVDVFDLTSGTITSLIAFANPARSAVVSRIRPASCSSTGPAGCSSRRVT